MDSGDGIASADGPARAPGDATAPVDVIDERAASAIVDRAVGRYIETRRALVPAFVDRHFSFAGTLRIHRRAVGLDLVRAPANVAISFANLGKRGVSFGLRRAGKAAAADRLNARNLFLKTGVGREIEWLVHTELLELPFQQGDRRHERDALIETILEDPQVRLRVAQMLAAVGEHVNDAAFRARVTEIMAEYVNSRTAAADITSSLFTAAAGFATYHKFTPGVAALSGVLAGSIAKTVAISNFWAGAWLGGLYYSVFAAHASPLLYASVFAGMMIPLAALTAFAGVIADPLQRRLGLHQRRLDRVLDVLENNLGGRGDVRYVAREHYVARVLDFVDWSSTILRAAAR